MTRFSLQKPVVRNYAHEWVFHKLLNNEGIINLRYFFINLKVNGENWGVYAVEEHFDKRLIEFNNRRDGPILSGDKLLNISDWRTTKVYQNKTWLENNPALVNQATVKMNGLKSGKLSIDKVLDVDLWGKYFAICELLNTWHGALEKSVKFYFNPITQKFEPIGYDGHFVGLNQELIFPDLGPLPLSPTGIWFRTVFNSDLKQNAKIFASYLYHLERVTDPNYLSSFLAEINSDLNKNIEFINSELSFVDLWHLTSFGSKRQYETHAPGLFYQFEPLEIVRRAAYLRNRLKPDGYVSFYLADETENFTFSGVAIFNLFQLR